MSFCRPLQQQSAEVDETAAAVPITAEMEFLRTPSLDMTNADLASLFADRQIIDDIIESVGVQTVPISPVSNNLYDMNLTSTSSTFQFVSLLMLFLQSI